MSNACTCPREGEQSDDSFDVRIHIQKGLINEKRPIEDNCV